MSTNALARNGHAVTALASTGGPVQVQMHTFQEVIELGRMMAATGFFKDVHDANRAVAKILYGAELGIGPMVALMDIDIIEGAPSPSANLIGGLIKASRRYNYRVRESTATRCEIAFFERNDAGAWEEQGVSIFTMEQASKITQKKRDGGSFRLVDKDIWKNYPDAMLFARAMTAGARKYCPDVFGGAAIYTAEELGVPVDYNPTTGEISRVIDVAPTPQAAPLADPTTGEIVDPAPPASEAEFAALLPAQQRPQPAKPTPEDETAMLALVGRLKSARFALGLSGEAVAAELNKQLGKEWRKATYAELEPLVEAYERQAGDVQQPVGAGA
jgi:hypothetical protein